MKVKETAKAVPLKSILYSTAYLDLLITSRIGKKKLNATKFAAHNVAEELIQELRRKAAEYRQKASHVD
ncbi:hypothetical protein [Scopulibacillus cellulosilyticus]|uniref:Uncharacterized protein n=1 Tax=Scopulibacillus cellulosilyticus TaxID=2665665 RepID=A0ABW2PXR8_9BACL